MFGTSEVFAAVRHPSRETMLVGHAPVYRKIEHALRVGKVDCCSLGPAVELTLFIQPETELRAVDLLFNQEFHLKKFIESYVAQVVNGRIGFDHFCRETYLVEGTFNREVVSPKDRFPICSGTRPDA